MQSLKILYIIVLRAKKLFVRSFSSVIQIYKKFARIYFPFLPHFAARLGNFTNFSVFFEAVVKNFVRLARTKISYIMQVACPQRTGHVKMNCKFTFNNYISANGYLQTAWRWANMTSETFLHGYFIHGNRLVK